jgi:superfamily II DNA or RNA helicase
MRLINNQQIRLFDELKPLLREGSDLFVCASYFSINFLFELSRELKKVNSIKILLDNQADDIRLGYDATEWTQYHDLRGRYKAETALAIIKEKCSIRYARPGGQKFILIKNGNSTSCFSIVPRDLNMVCLGLIPSTDPVIISAFEDEGGQYSNLFNQFWENSNKDIKYQVESIIEKACADHAPDSVYKFSLYHIFKDAIIDEASEQRLKRIGFKNTLIWNMLYNFQQDAVLGAIDKMETFGGCIIADSVGLGKTFEALAVMKYYQMRNDRILVLCPKKLRDNWLVYAQNDVRNILAKDRLNFDVLNHTDLSRVNGMSGYINLETVNWGNYDLVVIDESHNFRNNPPRKETITRYQRLMNDIIKAGVKTKVLMLSATPVNTRMNDIKNQIAFITEQQDHVLESYGIPSIDQTLRKAQQKFNHWLRERNGEEFNRDSLIESLDGSYFKILDLLTIARSRKHIQKYYDTQDIGKFPERQRPVNKYSDFDINGTFPAMDKVNNELNALNLKFYSPLSYVRPDKRAAYEDKYDMKMSSGSVFKQIERENSLIHLMRVNLLKRLESSIHAFHLTLESLLRQIDDLLDKVENAQQNAWFDSNLDINNVDFDDVMLEDLLVGGKIKVLLQDIDLIKCREELLDDKKRIENLISLTKVIDKSRDAKLRDLKDLISAKIAAPLNDGNKKIIIFSAFADTVKYLYDELQAWLKKNSGVYSAQVTGGDTNKTNLPGCKTDLSSILTHFSPVSKKREIIFPDATDEIDILFCTDCISEGQNLQDCDFLVNYDIHWNPVRIIQRFGRIDRIGSRNEKIQLVNFFPNLDLDNYIDLISRVQGRMQILDVSATGDDNIIDETAGQKQDLEYRRRQLKQLQNKVLDLEDIEGGISITDLTFNDFKIDADRLTVAERETFSVMPKGIFSVTRSNLEDAPEGIIFCLKDLSGISDNVYSSNAIFPFNLCYMNDQGEVYIPGTNPKRCLDYFKKLCLGKRELLPDLLAVFNKGTKAGKNMDGRTRVLQAAITHLKGVDDESGLDTLAMPGGTRLNKSGIGTGYELISFLVIK